MDPLQFIHEDVWSMIFVHFNVRDILKASLVSTSWESAIGLNFTCMKKVWLRFYWPLGDILSLLRSKRQYQNFKMQRELPSTLDLIFTKFRWKQAMIRDCNQLTVLEFSDIMKTLAESVEKIDLWDTQFPETSPLCHINFPHLTTLECNLTAHLQLFFGNNPRLSHVKINGHGAQIDIAQLVRRTIHVFLEKNQQISNLELINADEMFEVDVIRNVRLSLECLKFEMLINDENMKSNFLIFLRNQKSLKKVSVLEVNDWNFFTKVWNTLESCQVFHLNASADEPFSNLNTNPNIVELNLPKLNRFDENILSASPKLRVLHLDRVDKETVSFAAQNLPYLRIISGKKDENIIEHYVKLKQSDSCVNRKISFI